MTENLKVTKNKRQKPDEYFERKIKGRIGLWAVSRSVKGADARRGGEKRARRTRGNQQIKRMHMR